MLYDSSFPANNAPGTLTTIKGDLISREVYPNVKPMTYKTFYCQFAKALNGDGEVPVNAEEAASVIRLIELARLSSCEGRTLEV